MIIGLGNDYIDITRIEKAINSFGDSFINRIYTPKEQQIANRQGNTKLQAATYAKRWAAKEACSKALGTGMKGIAWTNIEITNLPSGKPIINLYGSAKKILSQLTPKGQKALINVTLTDDYPKAAAVVIISTEKI